MYFLTLPFVPIQKILNNLEPADLIDFSTLSTKCKNIVSQCTFPFTGIDLFVTDEQRLLQIFKENQEWSCFNWDFEARNVSKKNSKLRCRKFGKMKFRCLKEYGCSISSITPKPIQSFEAVVGHILDIFPRIPIKSITLSTKSTEYFVPALSRVRKCQELDIQTNQKISSELLENYILKLMPTKSVKLQFPVENENQRVDKIFECEHIRITYASWMTGSGLLNSKFSQLHLCNTKLNYEDYKAIIDDWMAAPGDDQVKFIQINSIIRDDNPNLVSYGTVWNSEKRARYFRACLLSIDLVDEIADINILLNRGQYQAAAHAAIVQLDNVRFYCQTHRQMYCPGCQIQKIRVPRAARQNFAEAMKIIDGCPVIDTFAVYDPLTMLRRAFCGLPNLTSPVNQSLKGYETVNRNKRGKCVQYEGTLYLISVKANILVGVDANATKGILYSTTPHGVFFGSFVGGVPEGRSASAAFKRAIVKQGKM